MAAQRASDWDPGAYDRFRGLRLRPALDLMKAVGDLPPGPVVDLGCGSGAAGPMLAARWPDRRRIGLDASAAMLKAAAQAGYDRLEQGDIAAWQADRRPALIFSNAALHWLPDHTTLLPRLAAQLVRGGVLAVQMPAQNDAPSHRMWLDVLADLDPDLPRSVRLPGAAPAPSYARMLAPLGALSLWETVYYQRLEPAPDGHPVRRFTEATFARPVLDAVPADRRADLIAAYEARIARAYPPDAGGGVLFPFRRIFFTLAV